MEDRDKLRIPSQEAVVMRVSGGQSDIHGGSSLRPTFLQRAANRKRTAITTHGGVISASLIGLTRRTLDGTETLEYADETDIRAYAGKEEDETSSVSGAPLTNIVR